MGATNTFDDSLKSISAARGAVYAHPSVNFRRIAEMQKIVDECPHEKIRVALGMIITKVARLIESPKHVDSVVDIAGYARTIAMIIDQENETVVDVQVEEVGV